MTEFRVFEGSYPAVFKELGLENYTREQACPKDMDVLQADLSRTPYFSEKLTVPDLKKRLTDEFNATQPNSYLQGDLFGGIVGIIKTNLNIASIERNNNFYPTSESNEINCCYVDDNNTLCGFSFLLKHDELTPGHYNYAFAIYRNISAPQHERTITYISSKQLLEDPKTTKGTSITTTQSILTKLQETLRCSRLFDAMALLITDKTDVSLKLTFKNIQACFTCNKNAYPTLIHHLAEQKMFDANLRLSYWERTGKKLIQRISATIISIAVTCILLTLIASPLINVITLLIGSYFLIQNLSAIWAHSKFEKTLNAYALKRDAIRQGAEMECNEATATIQSNKPSEAIDPPNAPTHFDSPIIDKIPSETAGTAPHSAYAP